MTLLLDFKSLKDFGSNGQGRALTHAQTCYQFSSSTMDVLLFSTTFSGTVLRHRGRYLQRSNLVGHDPSHIG